ncbi:MAG: ChbG/HpnK family deacetylase, partial [Solobacterium sp.]|nr:ChbG/HpnK family deacetylase [Solobacterium sp.]
MKQLLIRADDLGFSEAVNYGIEKTVKEGLIRSVGIMTNMPAASHGVRLLDGCDVCYGQHTNICAGFPLSDPAVIPSLVQENGEFRTSSEYRKAYKEGRDFVVLDEV